MHLFIGLDNHVLENKNVFFNSFFIYLYPKIKFIAAPLYHSQIIFPGRNYLRLIKCSLYRSLHEHATPARTLLKLSQDLTNDIREQTAINNCCATRLPA